MAAERRLKKQGLWNDLIPNPRELSSDCGMAITFHEEDLAAVAKALKDSSIKLRSVHMFRENGYADKTKEFYQPLGGRTEQSL